MMGLFLCFHCGTIGVGGVCPTCGNLGRNRLRLDDELSELYRNIGSKAVLVALDGQINDLLDAISEREKSCES